MDVFAFSLVLLEIAVGDAGYVKRHIRGREGYSLGHRPPLPLSLWEELPYLAELLECGWDNDPSKRHDFSFIERILERNAPS